MKAKLALLIGLIALGGPALAQSKMATGLRLSGKKPIQIESDRLEVRDDENRAIFSGNVLVNQGPVTLRAGRMIVYYKKGSGSAATGTAAIDRLEVSGSVHVRSESQVATADKGSYDMDAQLLLLTGSPVVLADGDNIIKGCKLRVETGSGQARMDGCTKNGSGRVIMLLDPNSKPSN